jgi:hypothetical protein
MDHEFELAFNLIDEAGGRIEQQQYGLTHILIHNHGPIRLVTDHHYTRGQGHTLTLLAYDDHGLMAAIQASAPDLESTPTARIIKVRAGHLMFHNIPDTWSYRAQGRTTYTITAGLADEPAWTVTSGTSAPVAYEHIDDAVDAAFTHEPVAA